MRHGGGLVLALLLMALTARAAATTADTEPKEGPTSDVDSDLLVPEEETLEAADTLDGAEAAAEPKIDPRLTLEAMEQIFSKMSARCLKQLQENAPDSPEVSDRCRREAASRIQRYLARLDREERGETADEEEKTQNKKKKKTDAKPQNQKSRKGRKQTRARRAAAAAQKKEEEYQKTLQVIIGFVVTFVAIIAGAMFVINRKLKAAGMYYSDPTAKATCCGN